LIQLHQLEGFYRVAMARGYARAARSFPYPISQPGVYQQVHKLELELESKLFERIAKDELRLTEAGRVLFDFCAPFFEGLPGVVSTIERGTLGGALRIDAAALELRHVLPSWLERLRKAHPELAVVVNEVPEPDYERLRRAETDLVVDYQPSLPADIDAQVIAEYRASVVAPEAVGTRRRQRLELAAMKDAAFVHFAPGSLQHAMQMQALRDAGCAPSVFLNGASVDGILGFVSAGLGYSLVPWPDRSGPKLAKVLSAPYRATSLRIPVRAAFHRAAKNERALELALRAARPRGTTSP
jgi:DNA-binding transcriptional LysR family regulator